MLRKTGQAKKRQRDVSILVRNDPIRSRLTKFTERARFRAREVTL